MGRQQLDSSMRSTFFQELLLQPGGIHYSKEVFQNKYSMMILSLEVPNSS
jgi:hypothetical protein